MAELDIQVRPGGDGPQTCPLCLAPLGEAEPTWTCPACATAHHAACVHELRGCATAGCAARAPRPPSVPPIAATPPRPAPATAPSRAAPASPRPRELPLWSLFKLDVELAFVIPALAYYKGVLAAPWDQVLAAVWFVAAVVMGLDATLRWTRTRPEALVDGRGRPVHPALYFLVVVYVMSLLHPLYYVLSGWRRLPPPRR